MLVTDRLLLREYKESDWRAVHAFLSDPEVSSYCPFQPATEEETREEIQKMLDGRRAEPPQYDLALILRSTDALIGVCRLMIRPDELRQGELLYLLNRHYWGHGYATEAVRAVLGYGFQELGLHRVYATCRPANVASSRVLEKVGMQREGHLRRHRWMKGAWHDSLRGDTASAMPALARALALGEPERLVGPFLEEGGRALRPAPPGCDARDRRILCGPLAGSARGHASTSRTHAHLSGQHSTGGLARGAHRAGNTGPAPAGDPPLEHRDGRGTCGLAQHGPHPHQAHLRQAWRPLTCGGSCTRPSSRTPIEGAIT
jgi:ribosomal-protein-alanine N-acetyltransferase